MVSKDLITLEYLFSHKGTEFWYFPNYNSYLTRIPIGKSAIWRTLNAVAPNNNYDFEELRSTNLLDAGSASPPDRGDEEL